MDFEIIFWLVVILLYLFLQMRGAARKSKQRSSAPSSTPSKAPSSPGAPAEPTLDDALREIRVALGMEEAPPEPPSEPQIERPLPEPTRASDPTPLERALPAPEPKAPPPPPRPLPEKRAREFQPIPTHYADAAFESKPTVFGPTTSLHHEPTTLRAQPQKPKQPLALPDEAPEPIIARVVPSASSPPHMIRQRLHTPQQARDAFVLSEILSPPRALRRS